MRVRSRRTLEVHGFTLVELMIAMVIGLLVVLITLTAYLGLAEAARTTEAQSRMNDDGQAALAVLSAHVRMAGNNPDQPFRIALTRRNPVYAPTTLTTTRPPSAFAFRGCARTFSNIAVSARLDDLVCPSGGSGSDSLAISYEADAFNTIPVPSTGRPTDCVGAELATATATLTVLDSSGAGTVSADIPYYVADNRFYVATNSATGIPGLHCRGNGVSSSPKSLIDNVEDLALTFGVVRAAASSVTAVVAGYLDASELLTHTEFGSLSDADRWSKVVSVRICVLIRSEQPVVSSIESARYQRCDGSVEMSPPDRRLRRTFSTTVVLRKRR
jgi:type IV pilus assembly protein PilW